MLQKSLAEFSDGLSYWLQLTKKQTVPQTSCLLSDIYILCSIHSYGGYSFNKVARILSFLFLTKVYLSTCVTHMDIFWWVRDMEEYRMYDTSSVFKVDCRGIPRQGRYIVPVNVKKKCWVHSRVSVLSLK